MQVDITGGRDAILACVDGTANGFEELSDVARLVVDVHGAAPGAAVAAAFRRDGQWHYGAGSAGRFRFDDASPRVHSKTIFDLASVTKPFTALALARLVRAGRLGFHEPLGDAVPALAQTASASVPVELFAAHRAGLEAHRQFYAPLVSGSRAGYRAEEVLLAAANARRPDCLGDAPRGGFPPLYSDLGYLLLGEAIAQRGSAADARDEQTRELASMSARDAAAAQPLPASAAWLDRVLAHEVIEPLGLRVGSIRMLQERDAEIAAEIAPTEVIDWRGGTVHAAVHDENAWAFSELGCSGHAGLFGDAWSVMRLGVALVEALAGERSDWLGAEDLAPLLQPRPGGSLLAGFDRRSGDAPLSGARFGPRTFGHLGFTGTSLWIDPDQLLVGVLLTNRVHPSRSRDAIKRARPAAYDAMALRMLGNS